ncbi:MAG: N-6 DNA methylase [Patescibacteria group bacterium]
MQTFQSEQDIRSSVDEQLKNLDWVFKGANRNVFQEQPREDDQKKKLKGKRPDYVLYSSKDKYRKEPLMVIETKKPGTNLNDALDQGNWYAEQLQAPLVFATDGIYYKTLHSKVHKPLYLNGEEVNELIRELEAIKFLENNEVDTISKEVKYDRQQLINIFEEANDLLRDEGLRAGIERFGEFANILFLKLVGEIEDLKEEEGKDNDIILDRYLRWSQWKNKKGAELLRFVNDTVLQKIGEAYHDEKIFLPLSIRNPKVLEKIIDKLEPLRLINIDSDIKGDSFEYFLKQSTSTKNDLGEYFTPRHIVKTMVKLINPQFGEKIYDPFCGTGGMLIETFKHIYNTMPRNPANLKTLQQETVFGNEITSTARITKMNMILIGDGHSGIQQKNSLADPNSIENKYDAVITNMPYSQKTEHGAYYDLPSSNGDSICVQHCIKAINKASENGRMAVVVPEGFLFRKDMEKTREYLLDRCYLKSIISLPQGVFLPYTGVKTNILYCTDIKKNKKQEKFWYFDVKNDGYTLDSHRRRIEGESDLQKFLAYRNMDVQERKEILSVGFSEISIDEVKRNDLVLSGNRYKKAFDYGDTELESASIGEITRVIRGVTYSKHDESLTPTRKAILRANNIDSETNSLDLSEVKYLKNDFQIDDEKKLIQNDILVCASNGSKRHLGKFALIEKEENFYCGGFMSIIRPNTKKVLPQYLYFILSAEPYREYIERITSGSSINNLKNKDVEALNIPLPSFEKQATIVSELEGYKKVLDSSNTIITSYEPQIAIDAEWDLMEIADIADIRPKKSEISKLKPSTEVSFVPMSALREHSPEISTEETRKISEVYQGYTYFRDNDVLLAKITPCFENGKSGIAKKLKNGIGFGSTEFIVIRANQKKVLPEWIYYFISRGEFIRQGKTTMTGSAGQQRINIDFVKGHKIPVPKIGVQKNLIEQISEERKLVHANSQLAKMMRDKINKKLDFIWGR